MSNKQYPRDLVGTQLFNNLVISVKEGYRVIYLNFHKCSKIFVCFTKAIKQIQHDITQFGKLMNVYVLTKFIISSENK